MKIIFAVICLLAFFYGCKSNSNITRGYVFTAPKRFLSGRNEKGCFSLHNVEPPVHVFLELHASASSNDDTNEEVLARTDTVLNTGVESCLELYVPFTKFNLGKLKLKMEFEKYPDYVVNTEKEVYIENDSILTFVETDKPVYKPGQNVNIRILMLKHDLRPWHKSIPRIWIENPSEVRVAQWTNTSTETGMCQLIFALSQEPIPGTWKIKVEKAHHQAVHTTTFEVKKYVLPRFQVTINSPGYILADAENITWKICAKYSYGKPVKGTLLLKTTPQTPIWRRKLHNLPDINYETKVDSPDGCTDFTISGESLGLPHWKVAPNNIILMANFTETGTNVVETVNSKTIVVHQSLKLEFVPYTPRYFKLGLPYHGKLRVVHHDDTPAPNEKIQLCLRVRAKDEWLRVVVECRNFTSSGEGFVDFVVPPQHKNIVLLSFVATGVDYPTKYYSPDKRWRVFMDQPSAYIDVNLWYSPSDSYLLVARGYQPIICEEKYPFNVMYTVSSNMSANGSITFHYSINSKGRLLTFGHVKHKPYKESLLNYSDFHNLLGAVETSANRTDQNQVVHRFPLSVKITPSMAPVSELLLYYVRMDGETVAATYTIEIGNCFENKVNAAWENDVQRPGSDSKLQVEAAPWSLCGISAVDRSTRFLASSASGGMLDAETTFKRLRRFHLTSEARPIQSAWVHCGKERSEPSDPFENGEDIDHLPMRPAAKVPAWGPVARKKKRHVPYSSGTNYVDAIQAFDDFGAIVMSDLTLETRPCPQNRLSLSSAREMDEPDRMMRTMMAMPLVFHTFSVPDEAMDSEINYADQLSDPSATLRSYFPETWLWELVPTGKEGKATIERTLPHTITDWIGHAVCISPKSGLGIAQRTKITAFQPFFLDYNLPYSVKRGETLHMKVSLFNYMHHSLPVKIKLEDARGLNLHSGSSTVVSFCVKPRDSVIHEYLLKPRLLGEINITVSAEIESNYNLPCGPEKLDFIRDSIVKPILVQPEGFPVELANSAFICPKDFIDDSWVAWNLSLPQDLVPDSARASVSIIGDILGPALENINDLVRLPMGCGEQNMILFVPNIHVIGYLDATGRQDPDLRAKAIKNMQKGYQRELNYRHPDGSYSAFGPDSFESSGSMWLTAFVVKSFAQARSLIHVDERDLKLSVKWIVRKQLENGCFPVVGRLFHKDMKGGLKDIEDGSSAALTAYVLISLLESGVPLTAPLIDNALYCLEKGTDGDSDESPYTLALTTYALALLEHPKVNGSLKVLMTRATRHRDLLWWEDKSKQSQLALSIEMTTYAVLTLIRIGGEDNMVEALKAVRWMSKQRNSGGGFTSTQDTVLGLEALSKYASAMTVNSTDLSVLVTAGPDIDRAFRINDDNRMVLSRVSVPILPTTVEVFAGGEGCVLVQTSLYYNKIEATGSEAFEVSARTASGLFMDECSTQKLTICARYKLADEESNMALLEIGMISGYVPDRGSLQALLEDPATNVQRYEEEKDMVVLYFNKLTSEMTCISFIVNRENVVDRSEPANIKLYDYYQQELTVSTSYKFPQMCSSAPEIDENGDDNHQIPNPVPIEPKRTTPTVIAENEPHAENEEPHSEMARSAVRSMMKALRKNNASAKNELNNDEIEQKTNSSLKDTEMPPLEKKAETHIFEQDPASAGLEPKNENVPLVESFEAKVNDDGLGKTVLGSYRTNGNVDVGSGELPYDESENIPESEKMSSTVDDQKFVNDSVFEGNPSLVVVFHELETPDGVEGPPPVYVKAPDNVVFDHNSTSIDQLNIFETTETTVAYSVDFHHTHTAENSVVTKENESANVSLTQANGKMSVSTHDSRNVSCPICGDKLPENLKEIYCSARSVIKLAVRRSRMVRLLWKVGIRSGVWEPSLYLISAVEFELDPACTCEVIDKLGTFAVLFDMKNDNYTTLPMRAKIALNSSISLYPLSDIVPDKSSHIIQSNMSLWDYWVFTRCS